MPADIKGMSSLYTTRNTICADVVCIKSVKVMQQQANLNRKLNYKVNVIWQIQSSTG